MDPLEIKRSFFFKLCSELKNVEKDDAVYFLSPYYPSFVMKRTLKLIPPLWHKRGEGGISYNPPSRFRSVAIFKKFLHLTESRLCGLQDVIIILGYICKLRCSVSMTYSDMADFFRYFIFFAISFCFSKEQLLSKLTRK